MKAASAEDVARIDGERDYAGHLKRLQASYDRIGDARLFTTDAEGLFERYLEALPVDDRQHHRCHACRRFVERFGGLVTIDEAGVTQPVLWQLGDAPLGYYGPSVERLQAAVRRARVTGVFLVGHYQWGEPQTGPWRHLAVTCRPSHVFLSGLQTPGQAMAEKREDYKQVQRALAEFPLPVVREAVRVLESDALYRSEKVLGAAAWLQDVHLAIRDIHDERRRKNRIWLAVGNAPFGFCHPRSSMIGTLLEDIAAGKSFEEVSRAFAAKMRPDVYQRPQVAPSYGNIAQAEKVVEKLGIARSLERRFARLEEVTAIWKPAPPKPEAPADTSGGVFGHLKPKGTAPEPKLQLPATVITWAKFRKTVLPTAERIELHVPTSTAPFMGLTTAVHADAPPILQWDRAERRNPVSHYLYLGGSPAERWSLEPGTLVAVTAIVRHPAHWGAEPDAEPSSHHRDFALFLLEGARDVDCSELALFPETLRSELHGIRSTIEAFSKVGKLQAFEEASACGLCFSANGQVQPVDVRVHGPGGEQQYRIDRWD